MSHKYSPEFKARIVLEVLRGDRELGEIAAEHSLHPNMVRTRKSEYIKNADRVFNECQSEKGTTILCRGGCRGTIISNNNY